jgi:hypothetical protein
MHGQRDFLLIITVATAVAASPCLGQTVAPAAEPAGSGTHRATANPDFSGIWWHPTIPGFELPASGPGPVTNRSRLPNGVGNPAQLVGDYTNPILKPWASDVVKEHGDSESRGEPFPTPRNQCWPEGVPFIFSSIGMQIVQQPQRIIILYSDDHEVRHVRMNESHPAHVTPSWYGDSIGHYEGDVLVIDTVGAKIGPFAMVDWYGTPHTEALHVVERYRLIDHQTAIEEERGDRENFHLDVSDRGFAHDPDNKGKGLQLHFTVEDEQVFTMPWSATVTYQHPLGEWPEYVCAENMQWYSGKNAAVPHADKPDF